MTHLIAGIDTDRQNANLSSAIRHFVLGFYRHQLDLSRMVAQSRRNPLFASR